MLKVAFLEANHWHLRPHLAAVKESGDVKLVALSGKGMMPEEVSKSVGVPLYDNNQELLDKESVDFVYIFGMANQTPSVIKGVVERGIPFIAEKPCGTHSEDLLPVLAEIKKKGAINSVPFGRRFAPPVVRYRDMMYESAKKGQMHFIFRYISDTPQRYVDMGCSWGLDPEKGGGGCLINLGGHFVDLVRYITHEEIVSVKAALNYKMFDTPVDDYATMLLTTANGNTATVEVGFSKPGVPYELYCMTGTGFYISGESTKDFTCTRSDGSCETFDFPRSDYYEECLADMVAAVRGEKKPLVSLEDGYESLKVINKAYENAKKID